MDDKDKLIAAIEALTALEGVPINFNLHEPIRELQEGLQCRIVEIEEEEFENFPCNELAN